MATGSRLPGGFTAEQAAHLMTVVQEIMDERLATRVAAGGAIPWPRVVAELQTRFRVHLAAPECQRLWRVLAYGVDIGRRDELLEDSEDEDDDEDGEDEEEKAGVDGADLEAAVEKLFGPAEASVAPVLHAVVEELRARGVGEVAGDASDALVALVAPLRTAGALGGEGRTERASATTGTPKSRSAFDFFALEQRVSEDEDEAQMRARWDALTTEERQPYEDRRVAEEMLLAIQARSREERRGGDGK